MRKKILIGSVVRNSSNDREERKVWEVSASKVHTKDTSYLLFTFIDALAITDQQKAVPAARELQGEATGFDAGNGEKLSSCQTTRGSLPLCVCVN